MPLLRGREYPKFLNAFVQRRVAKAKKVQKKNAQKILTDDTLGMEIFLPL